MKVKLALHFEEQRLKVPFYSETQPLETCHLNDIVVR